jgi:lipopolysaccharide exporter
MSTERDAGRGIGTVTEGLAPVVPAGTSPGQSVVRQVAIGAAFMIAGRLVIRGLSIISMLVLARLLVPEDFGLVALAGAAIAFIEVLSVTGYGMVLVRQPQPSRELYDTAWTLNILRCLLLAGLIAATAEWQAAFLNDPRIAPVLMVVALTIALDGFTSIGMYRLQREMQFDRVFRFQVVNKVAAFAASLILAVILQNYWCLVLGNLAAKVVSVPYSYWLAPHRPRLSLRNARGLLRFSGWMLVINAFNTADAHGPNLILGRWVGLPALGAFQVSYHVAAVPVHEVAVPVRTPIYAGYAKVQHDMALLRRHFIGGFAFLAAIMVPLSVGIALTAPQVERLALGPNWAGVAPLIALCALYSLADCLAAFTTNVFFVLDRLRPYVKTLGLLVLVRLPAVAVAALHWGVTGVVAVMLATAVLNALVWHWQVSRLLGHSLGAVAAEVWRSFAAAAAMALAVILLQGWLPAGPPGFLRAMLELAMLAACGASVHIGTQLLLWRLSGAPAGAEQRLLSAAAQLARRLRRHSPILSS